MSHAGPSLTQTKDGLSIAKFSGKTYRFGRFDEPETRRRFDQFKAQWLLNGRKVTDEMLRDLRGRGRSDELTIDRLADRFLEHLGRKHSDQWKANNHDRIRIALQPLRTLCGTEAASAFGPKRLQAVREFMILRGCGVEGKGKPLCRSEVNWRTNAIKRCFQWAVAEELVPGSIHHALKAVAGLREGEFGVREGTPRVLVPSESFEAVLPYLSRQVRALVRVLWWTGARPSEVLSLRPCDLDRSGGTWVHRREKHKTSRYGRVRDILFGPEAQAVLAEFLLRGPNEPLFSPREAIAEDAAARRAARQTPLWASHLTRYDRERSERETRVVGDCYSPVSLRQAVARAIERLNHDRKLRCEKTIKRWTPYQLRHSAGTRIRSAAGIEVARAVLGHTDTRMTEQYAEFDQRKAQEAMARLG